MFGLVAITCDTEKRTVQVRLAKEWSRDQLNKIPNSIAFHYHKRKLDELSIDQLTGEHFINDLKRLEINVNVITIDKDAKDPEGIENLEKMDKIEMLNMFIKFRQNKQIEFHPKPTPDLTLLEEQMTGYTEHITEAGNVDYRSEGKEHDHLTKALLMCCFKVRKHLEAEIDLTIVGGPLYKNKRRRPRLMGQPDFKNDTDVINALSGTPGRIVHYY